MYTRPTSNIMVQVEIYNLFS